MSAAARQVVARRGRRARRRTASRPGSNAEHPLFILYTSGSTGKPKGVQHSTGGYLLHAMLTMKWTFDHKPTDVFWCTADVGWVTGHTYIAYGPLAVGATEIVFEGVPTYPDAGRFWKMIQDHKVNVFYTAPTAIRSLIKAGGDLPKQVRPVVAAHPRNRGRADQPGGVDVVLHDGGRLALPDRGHLLADRDGRPHDHAAAGRDAARCRVVHAAAAGHHGRDRRRDRPRRCRNGQGGILVIKRPWPSMIRTIWGDPERFRKSYYPEELGGKLYLAGDGSIRDKERATSRIMGRIDDVLNVSGHRMGTMEIESALVANTKLVAEAAVVGRPDDMTGEAVVRLRGAQGARARRARTAKKIAKELRDWVAKEIGADRQAQGHPLRRQPAQDALRQDHAPAAALDRQGRGDHPGRLDAREPGDPGAAEAVPN